MITTQLPNFFNRRLIEGLGKNKEKMLEEGIKDSNIQTTEDSPAGVLFEKLTSDKDLNFIQSITEDSETILDKTEIKGIKGMRAGLFSKVLFDYYRENKFEKGNEDKNADVYLSKALNLLEKVQKSAFEVTIAQTLEFLNSFNYDEEPKVQIKNKRFLKNGNPPDAAAGIFSSLFKELMDKHFAFIDFNKKIEAMNKMFKKVKSLNTDKDLKAVMVLYFYDLVYSISIVSNFVSWEEASKILSE